jgi:hypothetical protein
MHRVICTSTTDCVTCEAILHNVKLAALAMQAMQHDDFVSFVVVQDQASDRDTDVSSGGFAIEVGVHESHRTF